MCRRSDGRPKHTPAAREIVPVRRSFRRAYLWNYMRVRSAPSFLCMLDLTRIGRLLVALRYSMYFRLYKWHHMELYRSTSRALFDDHLGDILVVVVEGSNDFIQSTHDHRAHARKKTGAKIGRVVSEICSRTDGRTDTWPPCRGSRAPCCATTRSTCPADETSRTSASLPDSSRTSCKVSKQVRGGSKK